MLPQLAAVHSPGQRPGSAGVQGLLPSLPEQPARLTHIYVNELQLLLSQQQLLHNLWADVCLEVSRHVQLTDSPQRTGHRLRHRIPQHTRVPRVLQHHFKLLRTGWPAHLGTRPQHNGTVLWRSSMLADADGGCVSHNCCQRAVPQLNVTLLRKTLQPAPGPQHV